jgi:acetyl-CoA carboxylase carboxyltransferase component
MQLAAKGMQLDETAAKMMSDEVISTYERESNAYYSTARLWDDGILDPAETRAALGLALEAALQAPIVASTNGVLRM